MSAQVKGELEPIMIKAIEKGWPIYYITPDQEFIEDIRHDCPRQYCVVFCEDWNGGLCVFALYRDKWQIHNNSARPLINKLIRCLVSAGYLEPGDTI